MANRSSRIWTKVDNVLNSKTNNFDKLGELLEIIYREKFIDEQKDYEMERLSSKINRQRKVINEYEKFIEFLKIYLVNFDEFEKDYKNFKRGNKWKLMS